MNEASDDVNEIIRVFIVDEDGNEIEVDQNESISNSIMLEITNTEDERFGLKESEYEELTNVKLSQEDALLLDNIKVEVIDDPEAEFSEYYKNELDEEYSIDSIDETEDLASRYKTKRKRYSYETTGTKPKKIHNCNICGYTSHQKSHYRRHLSVHFKPERLECGICKKPMIARVELNEHMDEHRCPEDRTKYKCHICSYTSNKLTNVSQHTQVHYKEEKEKFTCERCRFSTTNEIRFKNHISAHSNRNKTTKCPVCMLVFKSMALRRKHIQRYKSPEDPNRYQCPECSYTTIKFNNFKQHMVVHRSEFEVEMFQCSHCPFKSKRKTDLKQHIIVKHKSNDEVNLFQCEFCSYVSRRGNHLTSHMKNRHANEIHVKKCSFCTYKTVSKALIKKHVAIHSMVSEKNCLCFKCGYSCQSQSILVRHNTTCHNDEVENNEEIQKPKIESIKEEEPISYSYELVKVKQENDDDIKEKEITVCCCQFPQCKFVTNIEREAKIHHTICHTKRGDDNRCPECTFHTTSRHLYLEHLKVHKINIEHLKPHLCEICGTRWIRQGDLTRHMSVHWNYQEKKEIKDDLFDKKILTCAFCDYKTRIRLCLYKHMLKHGKEHQDNFNSFVNDEEFESD